MTQAIGILSVSPDARPWLLLLDLWAALNARNRDCANSVAEDLKSIVAKLGKHADVKPDGWPFLFQ